VHKTKIAISIVSHNQITLVNQLLSDLVNCPQVEEIIITQNKAEATPEVPSVLINKVQLIINEKQKGFGANHNAAFKFCNSSFYCVMNPDIRLPNNPFPLLIEVLKEKSACIVAPLILTPKGVIEDSFRLFPTPIRLIKRKLGLRVSEYNLDMTRSTVEPEWIAGMFMLFNSADFSVLSGFDENFYMYCEDVDICMRSRQAGKSLCVTTLASAVHDAQRNSRKQLKHLFWHLNSMARLWLKRLNGAYNSTD